MDYMRLKVVQIGNSRGIRLPKPMLEQAGIDQEVEIEIQGNTLVLRPVRKSARQDWSRAFQMMAEHGDDQLLEGSEVRTDWERSEWEWK